jgi:nicotinamidase/pyrazinamidase
VNMPAYDTTTALLVVDVQNDFSDPRGNLYVPGGEEVVARINEEIARAQEAGSIIVYSQDWHPPETPHFKEFGGVWPPHCVQGTWGAQFHPELHVVGRVIRKGFGPDDGYSGFTVRDARSGEEHDTDLAGVLREQGVKRVVIVGLATDYCVKETALDATRLGWPATVLTEATRAVNLSAGDDERAHEAMTAAGVTLD